jgi:threonyl-tRNA synthetase
MNTIEHMRHTLAHLLAAAVLKRYPKTKLTIGPAIEHGFYYDFDFAEPVSDKELAKIEATMRELLPTWKAFTHKEITPAEARKHFADNPYKLELIEEIIARGEKITLYTCGEGAHAFTDLCRGGHLAHPSEEIDPAGFTLIRVAGAYWKGNEKNKMLTRIYGLSFPSKAELDAHQTMLEEAKKRDHKKLGKELDLFTFSELVGAGLPLWTPKGTILRDTLDSFVWELRQRFGYERVDIPHITKKELYETSGHWQKFKDELFRINTREGHEFVMKPMNCPHHTQIYARKAWSYRELPQRYASTTKVYRDEQTGELSGLSRVRCITQDDAHVFCRRSQVKEEMGAIWEIIQTFYNTVGFTLKPRLSLHDPKHMEKYLGDAATWQKAEDELRALVKEKGATAVEAPGEAAFYGPKVDFMAKDSLGREWQVATIQLDMNMPERFDLTCTNEKSEKERVVMLHAAIMGSIERYLSVLIEHFGGNFPLWLSPVQARIIPVGDDHHAYASEVGDALRAIGLRSEVDLGKDGFGKKIRNAKTERIPYTIIIGDKEMSAKKVTLESRDHGKVGELSVDELAKKLGDENKSKKI